MELPHRKRVYGLKLCLITRKFTNKRLLEIVPFQLPLNNTYCTRIVLCKKSSLVAIGTALLNNIAKPILSFSLNWVNCFLSKYCNSIETNKQK